MACCLTAPSHYLNQSWMPSVRSLGIHLRALSLDDVKIPINKTRLKIAVLKWSPRGQWVKEGQTDGQMDMISVAPTPCVTGGAKNVNNVKITSMEYGSIQSTWPNYPMDARCDNNIIITSKRCSDDIIITLCVCWVVASTWSKSIMDIFEVPWNVRKLTNHSHSASWYLCILLQ